MDENLKEPAQTKILAWGCTLLSALFLLAGYGLGGDWKLLSLLLAIPLTWVLFRKGSAGLLLSSLLFVYVFLAALGLVLHLSPYLMIGGCAFALAGWESARFWLDLRAAPLRVQDQPLEALHNRDLTLAIGIGLLLALVGLNIRLQLPFGLIAILALLASYGLYRLFKYR
jgi:hypothetical protein